MPEQVKDDGDQNQVSDWDEMAQWASAHDIRGFGFDWPKYSLIEEACVMQDGTVNLTKTLEEMRSGRAFYQKQLRDAYAFKMQSGADYSDFTDRFDEFVRKEHDLGVAISYLEEIIEAASSL